MTAAAVFAAAAMAMPGGGMAADVTMPGRLYTPADQQVLVGQTVSWANDDAVNHTVTADDGSFNSGAVAPGGSYTHAFDTPGVYAYHCTIHAQMRGTIRVSALGLSGPSRPVVAGGTATVDVLAPAGTPSVAVEQLTASGATVVATATPDATGHAVLHLPVTGPARYQARAGDQLSPPVRVAATPAITLHARRHGRRIVARVTVRPALPGATIALERYVRERFDYRPAAQTRSRRGGTAVFRLSARHRVRLRGAVLKAPGGWAPGGGAPVSLAPAGR